MALLLETKNLEKTYKIGKSGLQALKGVSFSVDEGEFLAITGPSGSGKSTLLDLLGCLDEPTSGDVIFKGKSIQGLSGSEQAGLRNRSFGFVFQNFNLLDRANILDNVEMPLIYSGIKPAQRRSQAKELISKLGLLEFQHHHPNQLSGGQQQRVAIARALVNHPAVLFADEPTGNLDTQTGLEMISIFQHLNKEEGLTIILVTHEPEIIRYAGRVVDLRDGKIIEDKKKEAEDASAQLGKLP